MIITSLSKTWISDHSILGKLLRVSIVIALGFIIFLVVAGFKENEISIAMAITWIALISMIDRTIREK
ncbi:MAG: hypothetical protein F2519_06265 [Actinobacteria bacterium]|uniref:Unannotated protein n=1 Tax=freshwater metagenome TaxID=449393 RepID=A0A6J6BWB5_9ZZZZ|nr:hypothetical protein [Actinomycetota bacterium]MTA05162.1 hypothetical protein [Actinomycetota bacterium]